MDEIKNYWNKQPCNIKLNQEHIFPYKIPDYKQYKYIKEGWFEQMPEKIFRTLEKN